jgi:hypothetical protein
MGKHRKRPALSSYKLIGMKTMQLFGIFLLVNSIKWLKTLLPSAKYLLYTVERKKTEGGQEIVL